MPKLALLVFMLSATAWAGEADVIAVEATRVSDGSWQFSTTVSHADEGWDHYADRWEIVAPDGSILGERILLHPHEQEQPFTRSLSGVFIPPGLDTVIVRARDSVHGFGGREFPVQLPPAP